MTKWQSPVLFEDRLAEQLELLKTCIGRAHRQELELVRSSQTQWKSNFHQCGGPVEALTNAVAHKEKLSPRLPASVVPARQTLASIGLVSLGEPCTSFPMNEHEKISINDSVPSVSRPSCKESRWTLTKSNQSPSQISVPANSMQPPTFQGLSETTTRSIFSIPHPLDPRGVLVRSNTNMYGPVETCAPISRTLHKLIEEVEGMEVHDLSSWSCWPDWRSYLSHAKAWYAASTRKEVVIAIVDVIMSFAIVLNCLLVGISLDMDDWVGWEVFEYTFVAVFVAEILIKLLLLGWREMYLGSMWSWNAFDTIVVGLAIGELFVQASGSVTVLRVVRLGRVLRLMRLVKLAAAQELVMLLHGMIGGARCLFWCLVALALPCYIAGMILFQSFEDFFQDEGLFSSVPKAMFTTFRCMCGDCTDAQGRPIILHLANSKGWYLALLYTLFILVTIFGFFNLITAMFVERTMQAAKNDNVLQSQIRKASDKKFAKNIKRLVFMFWQAHKHAHVVKSEGIYASEAAVDNFCITDALELEISQELYDDVVRVPGVKEIFDNMGLRDDDIIDLFQILDVDHSGTLDITELVNGIHKLRGDASKRDLVSLAYMLYALQDTVHSMSIDIANLAGRSLEEVNNVSTTRSCDS